MLRIIFGIAVAAIAMLCTPAQAQDSAGPSDSARYTFHRVKDLFLRLDVQTGHVSECGWSALGWTCKVVPDERLALESEIARLYDQNSALKKALLERGLPLPDGIKSNAAVRREPGEANGDRSATFVGRLWRRMVEMMANLQRDMLRKG